MTDHKLKTFIEEQQAKPLTTALEIITSTGRYPLNDLSEGAAAVIKNFAANGLNLDGSEMFTPAPSSARFNH